MEGYILKFVFPLIMGFSIIQIIGIGILIKYFKTYWLISGYNTMSDDKKQKVNIEGLASFIGNMCFVIAAIMILATIFIMMGYELLGGIAFALLVPFSIFLIIKSQKYDGNTRNADGTMTTKAKLIAVGITVFLILVTIGVSVSLYYSYQASEITIEDGYIIIEGFYGEDIPINEIDDLYIEETLPKITFKNNGSSIGNKKKGNFKLEGIGKAKLFVDTSKPPFIYIEWNEKLFIMNTDTRQETEALFEAIVAGDALLKSKTN